MSIVVGTDFSEPSQGALTAAAHLAARTQQALHLVHALELGEAAGDDAQSQYIEALSRKLDAHADRLRSICPKVSVHLEHGSPDDVLLAAATRLDAKLVVVAALGKRRPGKWTIGSHADRLAQRSHVPVLVVREGAAFEAWARGSRALRIVLGGDLSASAKAAMQWAQGLRALGPCDFVLVHLYWPPAEFQRLGLGGVRSYLEPDPEVHRAIEHELRKHLLSSPEVASAKLRLHPHLGRVGDRIALIAAEEEADLIVVGSHMHVGGSRLLQEAVSHHVLHAAQTSVACVPSQLSASTVVAPKLANIVVATDLSDIGNAAVALAYSIAPSGATVHLLHVSKDAGHFPTEPRDVFAARPVADAQAYDVLRSKLEALVPATAAAEGKQTRVHLLESNQVAQAVVQAGERLDADVLCLGTHGRTGLPRAVLGSVAQEVLAHTRRPVLLARKPAE